MAKDFSCVFIKVCIKDVPSSEPYFTGTFDVSEKLFIELFDGKNYHTIGKFTIKELEANPALEVKVKFANFNWDEL